MKSVNRKVDHYVKHKEASAKKSKPLAPHLTYKVTHLPTSATVNTGRRSTSRNFSMTVSFYNPRFEKKVPEDNIIRHQCNQQNFIATSPDRMKSPKRNPILLNNSETVQEYKPMIKCFSTTRTAPPESVEYAFPVRGKGEFNQMLNPVNPEAKPAGKKTKFTQLIESTQEEPRTLRKHVITRSLQLLNPILHGHPDEEKLCKQRSPPEISEETRKLNDRKYGMTPTSIASSPKGRVYWDSSIVLGMDGTQEESQLQRSCSQSIQTIEPASKRHRRSDSMKDVINYEFALPYRDQIVTRKCNNVPAKEILRTHNY